MCAVRCFVNGLLEWYYQYDASQDPEFKQIENLIGLQYRWDYSSIPDNIGLLNTKTYKDPLDPRNPRVMDKFHTFGLFRPRHKRTPEQRAAFISWLGKILLIDYDPKTDNSEHIEEKANAYINKAIQHIDEWLLKPFEQELGGYEKSPYFKKIHKENASVYELLELVHEHMNEYRIIKNRQNPKAKVPHTPQEITTKDIRNMQNRNKAMYEIARIFAFASVYIDVEHVPGRETYLGDKVFLVSELLRLTGNGHHIDASEIMGSDNPFLTYTESKLIHWRKATNGSYEYLDEPVLGGIGKTKSVSLESMKITGDTNMRGDQKTVNVLHVDFRHEKDTKSAANKVLRKHLESPKEILDSRGFRFVVESDEDARVLLDILAYGLSSGPETAWAVKPEWQRNHFSWVNFRCLKGTIKAFHKRSDTRKALDEIKKMKMDDTMKERLDYLFSSKWHILETEIQIFVEKDTYVAAHQDPESPAFVQNYKHGQHLDEIAFLFPASIFPEASERINMMRTEKPIKQVLNTIMKSSSEET